MRSASAAEAPAADAAAGGNGQAGDYHVTPAVRMLVREHGVDLSQITGSGIGGRITKKDVLEYVQRRDAGCVAATARARRLGAGSGDSPGYVAYAGTPAGFVGANGGCGFRWPASFTRAGPVRGRRWCR